MNVKADAAKCVLICACISTTANVAAVSANVAAVAAVTAIATAAVAVVVVDVATVEVQQQLFRPPAIEHTIIINVFTLSLSNICNGAKYYK